MKNRKIITSLLLVLLLTVTGCGSNTPQRVRYNGVYPNIIELHDDSWELDSYSYVIDRKTNVVYLRYDGYKKCAITVMLNHDGSPVTAEQLEISVSDYED